MFSSTIGCFITVGKGYGNSPGTPALDHDDFGLNQSKIMNVIDSKDLERDMQISLRNLRKLDCAGKAAQRPTFPHPALGKRQVLFFFDAISRSSQRRAPQSDR
ncbi:MAG: hypothetical protein ACLPID_15040 [Beijerinckiaceae bacterium]